MLIKGILSKKKGVTYTLTVVSIAHSCAKREHSWGWSWKEGEKPRCKIVDSDILIPKCPLGKENCCATETNNNRVFT